MKSPDQLIQDARQAINAMADNARFMESGKIKNRISSLEKENSKLKKDLATSHRCSGQFESLYQRKNKECLRKQSEIDNMKRKVQDMEKTIILQNTNLHHFREVEKQRSEFISKVKTP